MTKKNLIRLIGAATCVAVMGAGWDAEAGWWRRHHGSSGGSWGSSGGSSGGSWGSHGSSGGSWGSHGSSGGSSGGSWGSHGSSGGSSGGSYSHSSHGSSGGSSGGSHGSSGGSHGSSGGGHVVYEHHHASVVNEVVRSAPSDTAKIVVDLPKDAKVFINGLETKATGSSRQFISKGLQDGVTYQYDVRIVTADKESPMEQTKVVKLSRGQTETVRFDATTATAVKPAAPKPDAVAVTSGN